MQCLKKAKEILRENKEELSALIMEPIVQGAGGMIVHQEGVLRELAEECKKLGILLILDEVATGFGRTGKMFACEHEDVVPDFLCVAKGITGGYLPLAATITTEEIFNAFLGEYEEFKTFFHGHTYTGNPLACAVALENLKLFEENKVIENMNEKISFFADCLKIFEKHKNVGEVRQKGFMVGIEIVSNKQTKEIFPFKDKIAIKISFNARKYGLITRPLGNVLVLMPPLSTTKEELIFITQALYKSLCDILGE
jgi:adenosylmethionine-8-amino-7-oxononanoate aminotransferase